MDKAKAQEIAVAVYNVVDQLKGMFSLRDSTMSDPRFSSGLWRIADNRPGPIELTTPDGKVWIFEKKELTNES